MEIEKNIQKGVSLAEEVKTGELSVMNYELTGFDESNIPDNRIAELRETFVPMLQGFDTHNQNKDLILSEFSDFRGTDNLVPHELEAKAKRHRLDIAKFRVATEKARKAVNEEINKVKAGNDSFAKYIKSIIESDEKDIGAIEQHNESIRLKQKEALQVERLKIVNELGYTEDTDFSGMAQTIFDSIVTGLKATKAEDEAAKQKQELRVSRQTKCLHISDFIANYEAIDLAELSEDAFNAMIEAAEQAKHDQVEAEKAEKEKAELHESRKAELIPYYDFMGDDYKGVNFSSYSDQAFIDIKSGLQKRKSDHETEQERIKAENDRLQKEKEEADKKAEAERLEREAKEKAEEERQAAAQKIVNEQREKAEREAREAKEAEELKTREAEEAKQAEEEVKRKLKEAEEKEAQRIASIKALAESSKEITVESIQKTIAEGKTIFVQVVSVEEIEGQAGIFIQNSEK